MKPKIIPRTASAKIRDFLDNSAIREVLIVEGAWIWGFYFSITGGRTL
jgi:hypothetical protein